MLGEGSVRAALRVTMTCSVLSLMLALMMATPPVRAQGVDETCVLPLTKTDPATVNVAYPDEGAIYFIGTYARCPVPA